ncbi:hypothetical protein J2X14_001759 [Pantoea alhagi]|uniref:hypothetical protein n=1 Tax=Mixta sp. BE291 TaxID=3158787 RepID=UPI002857AA82|nr:hypothetical protein [Pantoea alhagi]
MKENNNKFYILQYNPEDAGLPPYIDKKYTPDLPCFDIFTSPPKEEYFIDRYKLRTSVKDMSGDYFLDDDIVSSDLMKMCQGLNVAFLSFPLDIVLNGRKKPSKNYNLFYLKKYISILDIEESSYEISRDLDSGKLNTPQEMGLDKVYYEKITNFVIKKDINEDLFFCTDIIKPVCSEKFKYLFQEKCFSGINFIPIDNRYSYDAWDED